MTRHYSVLLQESIDALNCQSDGIYVDGTLGRGGHSLEIARRLQNGHLTRSTLTNRRWRNPLSD